MSAHAPNKQRQLGVPWRNQSSAPAPRDAGAPAYASHAIEARRVRRCCDMMCAHGVDCHAFVRTLASLGGALARRTSPSAAPQPPLSRPSAAHLALGLCATRRRRHGVVCLVLRAICPFPFGWALGPPVGRRPTRAKRASCVERNRIFTASPSASQRSASAQLLYKLLVQLHRLSLSLSASPQPQQAPAHSHHASEASRSKGAMAGGEGGWRSDVAGGALLDRRGAGALHGRTSASPSSNMLSPSLERVCVWESQCYMVELSKREKLSLDDGAARSAKWRWQW